MHLGHFVWFFIPETKGVSPQKMDELFGSSSWLSVSTTRDPEPAIEVREDNTENKN
jgi:hypothetical protein